MILDPSIYKIKKLTQIWFSLIKEPWHGLSFYQDFHSCSFKLDRIRENVDLMMQDIRIESDKKFK